VTLNIYLSWQTGQISLVLGFLMLNAKPSLVLYYCYCVNPVLAAEKMNQFIS